MQKNGALTGMFPIINDTVNISYDPQGDSTGVFRVHRGGSFNEAEIFLRCATRRSLPPVISFSDLGFRICKNN